jgi:hypothetical protein
MGAAAPLSSKAREGRAVAIRGRSGLVTGLFAGVCRRRGCLWCAIGRLGAIGWGRGVAGGRGSIGRLGRIARGGGVGRYIRSVGGGVGSRVGRRNVVAGAAVAARKRDQRGRSEGGG